MSGLFELLIILFFIAAAVFDAISRNRKREERKREMEEQEAAESSGRVGEDRTRRTESMGAEREWEPEREREPERETSWAPKREHEAERGRETAESMVPEDLWAILTGETPSGASGSPHPGGGKSSEGGYHPDEPPEQPHIPAPVPDDRMGGRPSVGGEGRAPRGRSRAGQEIGTHAAPDRRSSRWSEGVDEAEARDRDAMAADEARAFGTMEEPWDLFDDISSSEILDGDEITQDGDDEMDLLWGGRSRRSRRGSGRGQYTRLLETGRLEDLRKAVVLREVLGRPVGFRKPGDDLP